MDNKKERLKERNKKIRETYFKLKEKHQNWSDNAIIEDIAINFYLSVRTINAILSYESAYK